MSDTPQEIQAKFNEHMFAAHHNFGLDVHETSICVSFEDGFYNVRFRENHENRKKLKDAATEFAVSYAPPLNVNFV